MADPAISVPDGPTGLAFLSDGSALIVTARSRTVFRWSGGALSAHCDLAPLVSGELTDIAIDHLDRAYVTTFDATEPAPRCFKTARISLVTPDGVGRIAASGFALPNAVAISPDQRALIVCETFGRCLTRFNIDSDGGLGNRCTLQRFGAMQPKSLCLDNLGGIWLVPMGRPFAVRLSDGKLTAVATMPGRRATACALGGSSLGTLFCSSLPEGTEEVDAAQNGARVDVADLKYSPSMLEP
jgi:sugar lactone lactonase YvrE